MITRHWLQENEFRFTYGLWLLDLGDYFIVVEDRDVEVWIEDHYGDSCVSIQPTTEAIEAAYFAITGNKWT